jgi:hypothetical protein
MPKSLLRDLLDALAFKPREVLLRVDFFLGVAGAGGAAALAIITPDALLRGVAIAAGLVGAIIGATIAAVAVATAFMDQSFLRKLKAINKDPIRYVAPLLATAGISVFAMLSLVVLSTLSSKSNEALLGIVGGLAGFFTIWAIASLFYCVYTLVMFIGLMADAADVPDDTKLLDQHLSERGDNSAIIPIVGRICQSRFQGVD